MRNQTLHRALSQGIKPELQPPAQLFTASRLHWQAEPVTRDFMEKTLKPLAREAGPQLEEAAHKFTEEVLKPVAKQVAEQIEPAAQVRQHPRLPCACAHATGMQVFLP